MHVAPIKGIKDFSESVRYGRRFTKPEAMLTVRFSAEPLDTLYYGIIVRKKLARTSVMRNRIKRLLRESVRQWASTAPHGAEFVRTIVMTWNAIPKHSMVIRLNDVKPIITQLLDDAIAYNLNKREQRKKDRSENP